jgi:hypothetical protein
MVTTVCTNCESSEDPACSGCGSAVDVDALIDSARIQARLDAGDAIATILIRKVCGPMCEHPSCSTYRFAARIARQIAATANPPRIPEQGGDPT